MALPIITADQRLAEPRGIKGCIFGKSGIGKTSQLKTQPEGSTLFVDLEAGDLAACPTITCGMAAWSCSAARTKPRMRARRGM